MTDQMPINQNVSEERLIEEITGSTVPPDVPEHGDPIEPGDPEPEIDDERPS